MKKGLIKISLDTIPVLFGVLIALYISDYKEKSDNKKYLAKVFNSIELEYKENLEDIKGVIPKHEKFKDTLIQYLDDDLLTIENLIIKSKGFQMIVVKNLSWKNLSQSKIELLEYEIARELSYIEVINELMELHLEKTMDFVYENINSSERKHKELLIIHIGNLLETENVLLELHEKYLNEDEKD